MKKLMLMLTVLSFTQIAIAQKGDDVPTQMEKEKAKILTDLENSKEKFSINFEKWKDSLTEKDIVTVNGQPTIALGKMKQGCQILQTAVNDLSRGMEKTRQLAIEYQRPTKDIATRFEIVANMQTVAQKIDPTGKQCVLS